MAVALYLRNRCVWLSASRASLGSRDCGKKPVKCWASFGSSVYTIEVACDLYPDVAGWHRFHCATVPTLCGPAIDRKSTRLNSSHVEISYAVFCLKKKKKA